MAYDGLNRVRSIAYPNDKANQRKTAVPKYNRGGALQAMRFNGTDYVKEIAYNAKGQRVLMASGSLMQRYTYDPQTFRLVRTEARKYTKSGNTYTPAAGIRLDRGYEHDLMGSVVGENDRTPASSASQARAASTESLHTTRCGGSYPPLDGNQRRHWCSPVGT